MTRLIQNQAATVVRERDRRRLRAMAAVLACGGILVTGVLGYVWLHVHRVRVSYHLDELRRTHADLGERNRKLRLELLSLGSLARVDSVARQLGFREPEADQVQLAREFLVDAPDATARTAGLDAAPLGEVRSDLGTIR
jgi:cell division protein FtsL